MRKGYGCKRTPLQEGRSSRLKGLNDFTVFRWVHHDRNIGVVLRRGTNHGWPTDVDLVDHIFALGARSHGLNERVKIHNDKFEGFDAKFAKLLLVCLQTHVGK